MVVSGEDDAPCRRGGGRDDQVVRPSLRSAAMNVRD
jgi:hypothetical protein